MFRYNDAWLRINEDSDFTSGIYCGTSVVRTDGQFQVGSSGGKFKVTNAGNVTADGTLEVDELVTAKKGISTDGNAKFYNWRALDNTGGTSNNYHRIAKITSTQSTRFTIELVGRVTSYSDGKIPAFGRLVGQLNNDNNYDLFYYNHKNEDNEVVTGIGQVDVSTTATDIWINSSQFSEITAIAHISDGTIITYDTDSGRTGAPTGYIAASSSQVWNSTSTNALSTSLGGKFPRGSTTNYTTAASSNTDAWYRLFQVSDNNSCPIECHLRAYAHTSVSFIVSEGYQGGAAHINILDAHVSSINSGYKFLEGLRITSSGYVEIKLNGGSNVDIEMTLIGDATPVTSLSLSTEVPANIRDEFTALDTGMIRAYGDIYGGGDVEVTGDVIAFGSPSDKRYKENVKPIKNALDKVLELEGVSFDWKEKKGNLDIKEDIGFIAQDVQKVIPELVRENKDGKLSLRYQGVVPVLLEAIKDQQKQIDELKDLVMNLKDKK